MFARKVGAPEVARSRAAAGARKAADAVIAGEIVKQREVLAHLEPPGR